MAGNGTPVVVVEAGSLAKRWLLRLLIGLWINWLMMLIARGSSAAPVAGRSYGQVLPVQESARLQTLLCWCCGGNAVNGVSGSPSGDIQVVVVGRGFQEAIYV